MTAVLPDLASIYTELVKPERRPRTDRELWLWIAAVLGVEIPWQPVCEHHHAPFSWLADCFFERRERTLVRASRDSGKTFMNAILDLLNSHFKPECETTHAGSTMKQSNDGYGYLSGAADKVGRDGFVRRPPLSDYLAGEPIMEATVWRNGSKVQILTGASEKSVSGPHPQKFIGDEIDHWPFQTLNTALLMPRSRGEIAAQVHLASSQYHGFGTMAGLLAEAPARGLQVYEWCLFETMQRCPHCPNPDRDHDGRAACPLFEWRNPYTGEVEELCRGRGARSAGHLPYADAINKFLLVDTETAAMQLLLEGGSRNGLVYPAFTDEPHPAGHLRELPREVRGWRCWAGVDPRTNSAIECIAQDPRGNHWYFDEWFDDNATQTKRIDAARRLREEWRARGVLIESFQMDPSMPDEVRDWEAAGLPATTAARHPTVYGIGLIRNGLQNAVDPTREGPEIYVSERCLRLRLEWGQLYHLERNKMTGKFDPDRPADEDDHASDAARYALASGPPERKMNVLAGRKARGW